MALMGTGISWELQAPKILARAGSQTSFPFCGFLIDPPGDANFDWVVNFSDLLILAQHYGQPGEWVDGEFSGGGTVDFADLLTLAQNYGKTQPADQLYAPALPAGGQVPEPSALLLIAAAMLAAGISGGRGSRRAGARRANAARQEPHPPGDSRITWFPFAPAADRGLKRNGGLFRNAAK